MKKTTLLIALLTSALANAQLSQEKENPGSLFKSSYVNPLVDRVARQVGDILVVVIQEQSVANYSATTQTSKADQAGFTHNILFDLVSSIFKPFTASGSASTKGDGSTSHKMKMDSRMSVVIKQVLPNGNFIIEGNRSLTTNKDNETIVLTGMIRPFDIKSDNTVLSTQIAEAKISMAGKGQIQDRQRKGLINTLLDWLF